MMLRLSVFSLVSFTSLVSQSLADVDCLKSKLTYTYTNGLGYHKFYTSAQLWQDAKKTCENDGAHLAIVNSKDEEELLRKMFNDQLNDITDTRTTDEAFIGVTDQIEEGKWVTVVDESLDSTGYVNWGTECYGQQPDGKRIQNCAALTHKCPGMDDT